MIYLKSLLIWIVCEWYWNDWYSIAVVNYAKNASIKLDAYIFIMVCNA